MNPQYCVSSFREVFCGYLANMQRKKLPQRKKYRNNERNKILPHASPVQRGWISIGSSVSLHKGQPLFQKAEQGDITQCIALTAASVLAGSQTSKFAVLLRNDSLVIPVSLLLLVPAQLWVLFSLTLQWPDVTHSASVLTGRSHTGPAGVTDSGCIFCIYNCSFAFFVSPS